MQLSSNNMCNPKPFCAANSDREHRQRQADARCQASAFCMSQDLLVSAALLCHTTIDQCMQAFKDAPVELDQMEVLEQQQQQGQEQDHPMGFPYCCGLLTAAAVMPFQLLQAEAS